jgi:hypothetical protein
MIQQHRRAVMNATQDVNNDVDYFHEIMEMNKKSSSTKLAYYDWLMIYSPHV